MVATDKLNSPAKRRRFLKARSRQLIYGDWLTQVFAFLIVGSVYIGITRFGISVYGIMGELTGNMYASILALSVFVVLALFVLVPLLLGTVNFEVEFLEKGKADLKDIFYYFSENRLLVRSYRMTIYAVLKCVWYFLPALALSFFVNDFYYSGIFGFKYSIFGKDAVYFALSAIVLALFAIGTILSSKIFVGIFVCSVRKEKSVSECFFVGSVCSAQGGGEMTMLVLSFVPLFVLSLLSMGFLFVMFTFPYMLLSITMLSKYLYEKEMSTKKVADSMYADVENNE